MYTMHSIKSMLIFIEQTCSIKLSVTKLMTWQPTMGAQVSSVKMFRMKGSGSPCLITMFAI